MGKKCVLTDFRRGMIVGASQAGLSISVTVDLLGISRTTVSRVYSEWCKKTKTSNEWQFCGLKCDALHCTVIRGCVDIVV